MTPEERDAQLAKPLNAIVAVVRRSGGPQLTPVWFYWDGAAFYVSTTRSRGKYPNIQRHPEVSLIVDDLAAHKYVAAYGRAEIVEGDRERVVALTVPILEKYMPGKGQANAAKMEQDRVVVILRPERIVTN
ncbi:MAG TPA: TIGR03618 family F420-dependent PPOX class oxidoreductase [Ktedonobacterales bacterium]|nr:TIGR03618 family F420-dependent PPOX class oxidoreductase [Ktedonobacterales bacterium]